MVDNNSKFLKFQLKLYYGDKLRKYYTAFICIVFGIAVGIGNENLSYDLSFHKKSFYSNENELLFCIFMYFIAIVVGYSELYKDNFKYYMDIGFTRKKYYLGNSIICLINSFFTSIICYLAFIVAAYFLDKIYLAEGLKNYVQFFGFKFSRLEIVSALEILVLSFIVITVINMLANLIAVSSMISIKNRINVIPSIVSIVFTAFYVWNIYLPVEFNRAFEKFININNNYILYMLALAATVALEYILGKNLILKVDIKDK